MAVINRTVVDKRTIVVDLDPPIIGQDYAGPDQPLLQHEIDSVTIHAVRDGHSSAWAPDKVETRGVHRRASTGERSGIHARREYHPDEETGYMYSHADMPSELAQLVHDELARPDELAALARELVTALDGVDMTADDSAAFERADRAANRLREALGDD